MELATLKEIGHRIQQRRKELKLSERDLSEYLGITIPEYEQIERGERSFSVEEVQAFCLIFHVSADYLVTGQLGILECSDLIQVLQETPESYRRISIAMAGHLQDVAFGKATLLTSEI